MATVITRGAASVLGLISSQQTSYTFDPSVYTSPRGNPVTTPTVNILSFFWPSQLYTGRQFTMTGYIYPYPTTGWPAQTPFTSTMTVGTAKTETTTRVQRKQFFIRNIYDGANSISCYGFYSGDSTNYPLGQISIIGLALV